MPYARVILGPRYAVRLEDLAARNALLIECMACGHRGLVAPHRLWERFPAHERLLEIGHVMRCPRCRAQPVIWHVVEAARG